MQLTERTILRLPNKGLRNRNTHQGVDDFLRTEYGAPVPEPATLW